MARGDQLGRQWRIIQTLISSHRGKTAAELAEDLEVNPRTVYRDLEALQVAGFPIYTDKVEGKEKIWHESQEIHLQDDGAIIFEAEVAGTDEVKFWIMSWGSNALVLEPESLINEIKAEAEKTAGRYGEVNLKKEKPLTAT